MGLARPQQELAALLDSLATPGGVTRLGLGTLRQRRSIEAWTEALDVVLVRLKETS
jgi:hypothetical protein